MPCAAPTSSPRTSRPRAAPSRRRIRPLFITPSSLVIIPTPTQANAALNGAAVRTARLDWHDQRELDAAAAAGPYTLVIGASLQFEQWDSLGANLWAVLSA